VVVQNLKIFVNLTYLKITDFNEFDCWFSCDYENYLSDLLQI